MHLFHFSAVSVRISWGILRRAPTFCLGIGSSEKRVLESMTLTLSAHETIEVAFFMAEDGGRAVFYWFACRFFAGREGLLVIGNFINQVCFTYGTLNFSFIGHFLLQIKHIPI
jgi:hypothetical protein